MLTEPNWLVVVLTVGFGLLGWLSRRVIRIHDQGQDAFDRKMERLHETLKAVLDEAKDTNHRITVLEARALVAREQEKRFLKE